MRSTQGAITTASSGKSILRFGRCSSYGSDPRSAVVVGLSTTTHDHRAIRYELAHLSAHGLYSSVLAQPYGQSPIAARARASEP
jgi:hypothetical protein